MQHTAIQIHTPSLICVLHTHTHTHTHTHVRANNKQAEGQGGQSESWQMKSYTYQDEHASIHVVNVHNTYKHNMVYTKYIVYKVGREHSSIVEQLSERSA